ncbi:adenylyltransferase/cytidyltransferase family protein [Flammeovirga sp. SubArs3]|uniref:adenylyltransferase/cytidyltransferase family protein n=1 Tax=Flammeovirga sp. SubArs3 TaxID=2995316 RepID=UPI00248C26F6|nr:adenylyltransferase/cytidyltransferase family protein [Flammeovirga sp. SubArs3]
MTKKNIYVVGVFDLFHRGHLELLKKSKALGTHLIVALNGDDMTAQYKRKPFVSEDDRLAIIESLECVDHAFIINQFDNKDVLVEYDIDVVVHGDDWDVEGYMEQIRVDQEFLDKNKIELAFLPYTQGISTSELIKTIKNS